MESFSESRTRDIKYLVEVDEDVVTPIDERSFSSNDGKEVIDHYNKMIDKYGEDNVRLISTETTTRTSEVNKQIIRLRMKHPSYPS